LDFLVSAFVPISNTKTNEQATVHKDAFACRIDHHIEIGAAVRSVREQINRICDNQQHTHHRNKPETLVLLSITIVESVPLMQLALTAMPFTVLT
jgi:hypothetical protein